MFAAACTTNTPAGGPSYDSVRERLSDGPTRLFVASDGSTGTVTARRWTQTGWIEGATEVTVESGELSAKVDAHGALKLEHFEVNVAPIAIPEEVFKKPASLTDVRVSLREPATTQVQWTSENDATMQLTLALDFDWAIAVNGGTTPLATQHLPPVTIDVMVTGGGDHIDASVGMQANGELWSWAGVLEMTAMQFSLSASTLD